MATIQSANSTPFSKTSGPSVRRWRDFLELSIGYALILVVIWTRRPIQRWFYWVAVGWILFVTCISFQGWKALGFRITGLWRSLWVIAVALLIATSAFALAYALQTLHTPGGPIMWIKAFLGYAIWSFVQQLLLQGFFLLRLLRLLPNKTAAVVTAATIFAAAHLPNPILTPLTLLWGLSACFLFLRYRNIYPLAVAHAILGICITVTIPAPVIHNMRVGRGYLIYHAPHHHHRNQSDQTVSTEACVIADAPTRRS
jgi:Type II CAAX prenyl endopeptidase Rce1-like